MSHSLTRFGSNGPTSGSERSICTSSENAESLWAQGDLRYLSSNPVILCAPFFVSPKKILIVVSSGLRPTFFRDGDFAYIFRAVNIDFLHLRIRLGAEYRFHVTSCNLDLSSMWGEVKSAVSPHKLLLFIFHNLSSSLLITLPGRLDLLIAQHFSEASDLLIAQHFSEASDLLIAQHFSEASDLLIAQHFSEASDLLIAQHFSEASDLLIAQHFSEASDLLIAQHFSEASDLLIAQHFSEASGTHRDYSRFFCLALMTFSCVCFSSLNVQEEHSGNDGDARHNQRTAARVICPW